MIKRGFIVYVDKELCTFNLMYIAAAMCDKGCKGCSAATDQCDIDSYGPFLYDKEEFKIENGDLVDVVVYPKTHLIPAFLLLILPLLIFFMDYWIYAQFTRNVFIIATVASFVGYMYTLLQFNKKWKTITKGEVIKVEK